MQDAKWRDADSGFVASLPGINMCKKVGTDGDAKYIMYVVRDLWAGLKSWNKGFYLGMWPDCELLTYHFIFNSKDDFDSADNMWERKPDDEFPYKTNWQYCKIKIRNGRWIHRVILIKKQGEIFSNQDNALALVTELAKKDIASNIENMFIRAVKLLVPHAGVAGMFNPS